MESYPKILLVDDEPLNLDYLAQELEDREVEILTAANGQEAMEVITRFQPDMIFLDIHMPEMDGFAVLEHLKADLATNSIPVVIISAATDMSNIVKGIELGAEDFLPKPFNPVLLHARLNAGLEKKRLRDIERLYTQSLERELEIGRRIQAGFLPQKIPQPTGWEIEAYFCPAREVAGDFYDAFNLAEGQLALVIGDVADKGVGSALYMALYRSLLRATMLVDTFTASATDLSPELRLRQAVTLVNNYLCETHPANMFATIFAGVLDPASGKLWYVNAGHERPYILRDGVIHASLDSTGPLVGVFEDIEYRLASLQLVAGDSLILYSDGILDAQNPSGERLQSEGWEALLVETVPPAQKRIDYLTGRVCQFMGDQPQYDDISLLVVGRL
jgi:serine phosphatase RsbU (regulator of sigma subunit)